MSNETIFNLIKNKDYVIRSFLFKIIKENNLTVDESLLLIFLTNQEHPQLDLSLINSITCLKKEEILSAFSSLTKKGLISTIIKNDDDKIIEEINLEEIYKLASTNINKELLVKEEKNIFELFESEFGRPLTPMEFEFINAWINSGMNQDLIKEALKEATYNGVSNLRYIDKIIYEWTKKNYKTVEDVKNGKLKKDEKKENNSFFEYNWLDEN